MDGEPCPLPRCVVEAREAGDEFALAQELPMDWAKERPEKADPALCQPVGITTSLYGPKDGGVEGENRPDNKV